MGKILINKKLLAHIHNDPFLLGSHQLQGSSFVETIGYLNQYLAANHDMSLDEDVVKLQSECTQLAAYEESLQDPKLHDRIYQDILNLPQGKSLFMPGGWVLENKSGHAMIYEFKYDKTGALQFCIYNSGTGLNYHHSRSATDKTLYNPILTYTIPHEKVKDPTFALFIKQLLDPQRRCNTLAEANRNAEYLYENVFPSLLNWGGVQVDASPNDGYQAFTAGQIAGTCAERSLHQLLKTRFKSLDAYRKFIYGFKAHALDDYFTTLKKDNPDLLADPIVQSQIKKAIRHTLRLLNLKKENDPQTNLFSTQQRKQDVQKLTGYLQELKKCVATPQKKHDDEADDDLIELAKQAFTPLVHAPFKKRSSGFHLPTLPHVPKSLSLFEKIKLVSKYYTDNPKMHPKAMPEGLNLVEQMKWLTNNIDFTNPVESCVQLEHFFLSMSLPKNYQDPLNDAYKEMLKDPEKTLEFYNLLKKLQSIYFDSYIKLTGDSIPTHKSLLVKGSISSLINYLNFHSPTKNTLPYVFQNYTQSICRRYYDSVDLGTRDPLADERFLELQALESTKHAYPDTNRSLINHYQHLLETYGAPFIKELTEAYEKKISEDQKKNLFNKKASRKEDDIHKNLRGKNWDYRALYYFTTELFTKQHMFLSDDEKRICDVLCPIFELQKTMELTINDYQDLRSYERDYRTPQFRWVSYHSDESSDESSDVIMELYPVYYKIPDYEPPSGLENSKTAKDILQILNLNANNKQSDNDVIDLYSTKEVDKNTRTELNSLNYLRHNSASQLQLMLDYFKKHMSKLAQKNMQVYFEKNLFQPGLLFDCLRSERSDAFLKQFDDFIQYGIQYLAVDGEIEKNALFLIRMAYEVNVYASQQMPQKFASRIPLFYEQINQLLKKTSDINTRYKLKEYIALLGASGHLPLTDEDTLAEVTEAIFQTQKSHQEFNLETSYRRICEEHKTRTRLSAANMQQRFSIPLFKSLFKNLGITFPNVPTHLVNQHPVYQIVSSLSSEVLFTVDLNQGFIYNRDGMALINTPLSFINSPVFASMGLTAPKQCFLMKNPKRLQFDFEGVTLQFFMDSTTTVQAKWGDEKTWYQLVASTKEQAAQLGLASDAVLTSSPFPLLLKNKNTLTFISEDDKTIRFTTNKGKIAYEGRKTHYNDNHSSQYNQSGFIIEALDKKGRSLCFHPPDFLKRLTAFEAPKFIQTYSKFDKTTQKEHDYSVEFYRYGLTLSVSDTSMNLQYQEDGKTYNLVEKQTALGDGVAHLIVENATECRCLLPVLRFIQTNTPDDRREYYRMKQDLTDEISQENIPQDKRRELAFTYDKTESYLSIKMINGQPVPETPAQALYLCYLYLGTNHPKKAWKMLEYCQKNLGGLSGSKEEYKYLQWIMNELPHVNKTTDKRKILATPQLISCKLKTLSLFTDFAAQQSASVANDDPSFISLHITSLYRSLQTMRPHLPVQFQLSDDETMSLLDFYHNHNGDNPVGAMGYEWIQLKLRLLKKEWVILNAKKESSSITQFELNRLQDIKDFLDKYTAVAKVESKLSYRPLDLKLDLKETQKYLQQLFKGRHFKPDKSITEKQFTELNLTPFSSLNLFENNLDILLNLVHGKLPKSVFNKFQTILQSSLINLEGRELSESEKKKRSICMLLYRMSCTDLRKVTLDDLFSMKIDSVFENLVTGDTILIPELEDTTSGILAKTYDLWKATPPQPRSIPPAFDRTQLHLVQLYQDNVELDAYSKTWHNLEKQFIQGEDSTSKTNQAMGQMKYQAMEAMKSLAQETFGEEKSRALLTTYIQQTLANLQTSQAALEKELLDAANQMLTEDDGTEQWELERAAKLRSHLDIQALLTLYFQNDMVRYKEATGLDHKAILKLHHGLAQYVNNGLNVQHCQRIQEKLQHVNKALHTSEEKNAIFQLARTVFAKNMVDVLEDPAISVFQLNENILLRPQQKEAIDHLLNVSPTTETYSEAVERLIMGGGKSKVLLPTLAQKKATGTNLVILEVPPALLNTNFKDLQVTSARLYHQKAYKFEFDRNGDSSAKRLEEIFNQFNRVMLNKGYIVTTGNALQSLELKFIELLAMDPSQRDTEWRNQVKWADRLLSLLRNRGDLIIDEVHQSLSVRNKLNYNMGEKTVPSAKVLKRCIKLYQFIELTNLDIGKVPATTLLTSNQPVADKNQIQTALHKLTSLLVTHIDSPLVAIIKTAKLNYPNIQEEIECYLKDEGSAIPEFILQAPHDVQELLALYKEQLNHLLPYTLNRKHGEQYGPSQNPTMGAGMRALSIPYHASNVPSEGSRFENELEEINYSIQSMLITGISLELLQEYVKKQQTLAREELLRSHGTSLDDTETAKQFNALLRQQGLSITLNTIRLDDEKTLIQLHKALQHYSPLIFRVLETQVLSNMQIDPCILHNDAINHVDIVHSCQGLSGTPGNYRTYHQRLSHDPNATLGMDEYIIHSIAAKTPHISGLDFTNTRAFISSLLCDSKPNRRAIIDVGARFKGIDNLEVVKEISRELMKNKQPIKYVIFFHNNVLSAWNTQEDDKQIPIVLGTSDPTVISQKLRCTPNECFTFYDQSHTIGTDIAQSNEASALVLIDQDTQLQNFLQASLRMRGILEGSQQLDIVVPQTMENHDIHALIDLMKKNEQDQLIRDNYEAAYAKLSGLIRNDLMKRLLNISGPDAAQEKAALLAKYKHYFVEEKATDLFEKYGGLSQERKTKDLLELQQKKLLAEWKSLVGPLDDVEINKMEETMALIITEASRENVCLPLQKVSATPMSRQVEVQKQVEKHTQKEVKIQVQYTTKAQIPEPYISWGTYGFTPNGQARLMTKTLTEICRNGASGFTPQFDDNIVATQNFYRTNTGSLTDPFIGPYLKPVFGLLFESNPLKCTLLSQQEFAELEKKLGPNQWITTTQHTLLAGTPLPGITQDKAYQRIIEQVRYFNGEINLLLEDPEQLAWLKEETKEKLDYLANTISACHDTNDDELDMLRTALDKVAPATMLETKADNLPINTPPNRP